MMLNRMRKEQKSCTHSLTCALVVPVICCVTLGLTSCFAPQRTKLGESRSPDGKIIASVYRDEPSGIGTGEIDTIVELNWTTGKQPPTTVLAFDDGLDVPEGDKSVGMDWKTPTQLELTYKGPRHISFQALRWHGVEIAVRDRSPAGPKNPS